MTHTVDEELRQRIESMHFGGRTLERLSDDTGVSSTTISRFIKRHNISRVSLYKLRHALGGPEYKPVVAPEGNGVSRETPTESYFIGADFAEEGSLLVCVIKRTGERLEIVASQRVNL